ncbi:hypothetical protein EBX93_14110 [bacterium]|nr:hypothetical protein [bacterium]
MLVSVIVNGPTVAGTNTILYPYEYKEGVYDIYTLFANRFEKEVTILVAGENVVNDRSTVFESPYNPTALTDNIYLVK